MNRETVREIAHKIYKGAKEIELGYMEPLVNGRIPVVVVCTGNHREDVGLWYQPASVKVGDIVSAWEHSYYDRQEVVAVFHMDGTLRMMPSLAIELANL